jgi:hypothetical protein
LIIPDFFFIIFDQKNIKIKIKKRAEPLILALPLSFFFLLWLQLFYNLHSETVLLTEATVLAN